MNKILLVILFLPMLLCAYPNFDTYQVGNMNDKDFVAIRRGFNYKISQCFGSVMTFVRDKKGWSIITDYDNNQIVFMKNDKKAVIKCTNKGMIKGMIKR